MPTDQASPVDGTGGAGAARPDPGRHRPRPGRYRRAEEEHRGLTEASADPWVIPDASGVTAYVKRQAAIRVRSSRRSGAMTARPARGLPGPGRADDWTGP